NNKAVKVRSHVQRTSYKISEKLTVIQEAKQIGVLAASCRFGRTSFYPTAEKELIKWLNELRQIGIAVTSGVRIPSNLPCGIVVCMHESAWMDENLMSEWIDQVWNKRPGASIVNKPLSLLNSEIDDNEDLFEVVEEDSLSAEELED
ncbi:16424_t:CDS:2, partial [Cetraspora pellucida]